MIKKVPLKTSTVFATAFLIASILGFINGRTYVNSSEFLTQQALQPVEVLLISDSEPDQAAALKASPSFPTRSTSSSSNRTTTTRRDLVTPNKDSLKEEHFFDYATSPEAIQEYFERQIKGKHYDLVYRYKGKILYLFNTKTKEVINTPDATLVELQKGEEPAIKYPVDREVIVALVGGSTAGITITELVSKTGSIPKKVVIAGVLGAVSGYSLGYKLATLSPPGPESAKIRAILESKEHWQQNEKILFKSLASQTFLMAEGIQDPIKAERYKQFVAILYSAPKRELRTYDWMALARVFNDVGQVTSANSPVAPEQTSFPFWLSWWWVGLVVLSSFVGVVVLLKWSNSH